MQRMLNILTLGIAMSTVSSLTMAGDDMHKYEITVTNGTTSHVMTPPAVIAHNRHFSAFMVGQMASDELATQAESGNPAPLLDMAANSRGVKATAAGTDVILPGQSQTISIMVRGKHPRFTVTSMLASTNDAFVAVNGVGMHGSMRMMDAIVYDAGSEGNNEDCAYIPGPPCGGSSRDTATAEGFVSYHSGIKGIGGVDANKFDWRGPVAQISIKKMD